MLWQPGMDPVAVAGLAGTRTYPLSSSFRPSYNMAVNLVGQVGRERAPRRCWSRRSPSSRPTAAVVGLARQARRIRESMADSRSPATSATSPSTRPSGGSSRDARATQARQRSAARQAEAAASLQRLRRGDIIQVPGGRRAGLALVLEPGPAGAIRRCRSCSPRTIRSSGCRWPTSRCRSRPSTGCGSRPGSAPGRRSTAGTSPPPCATSWPAARPQPAAGRPKDGGRRAARTPRSSELRRRLRQHPCHGCPDREEHARQRGALSPAGAGGRGAGTPGGGPDARDRADVRPGLRGARRSSATSKATR